MGSSPAQAKQHESAASGGYASFRAARLELEDGSCFEGKAFGALRSVSGEVVFATGMVGYPESLTDPSYCGQLITMTYPHIGNYGINLEDIESQKIQAAGFIVREENVVPSNFRSTDSLGNYLRSQNIVGIQVEVYFKPIYDSQPLFSDVDALIRNNWGLELIDIRKVFWKYKDNSKPDNNLEKWLSNVREFLDHSNSSAVEFLEDFKGGLYNEEVFVFPRNFSQIQTSRLHDMSWGYRVCSHIHLNCARF